MTSSTTSSTSTLDPAVQARLEQLEQELAQARANETAALDRLQRLMALTANRLADPERDVQRAFYETILDELPVEVVVLDEQFRYIYSNPQAVPDPEHRAWLIGHTVIEYCERYGFPMALAEHRSRMFEQALRSSEPVVWDDCTPYPEGPRYHQRHFKLLAQVGAGEPFMLGYGLDVTARVEAEARSQRSEAAQREQQEFMQQVLDTNPSAIYVRDAEGQFVFSNRAMAQLVRTKPDHPQAADNAARDAARYAVGDDLVLATGQEITSEDCLPLVTGEMRWFHSVKRPLLRPDGSVHVLGVSTDISDLKQAQDTLARSEKQYRDLMHYAQALICTYDLAGNMLSVNPALANLLGHPATDVVGQFMTTYLLAEDQAGFADFLDRISVRGEAQGVLRVLRALPRGSFELRHLLYHTFVVREPGQEPYIISHSHDITDRILAERESQRARDEAEASARARENFLANMSHEIRTPMNGVLGMTAQLAKTRLDARQQELVRVISSSGRHLLAVLNDVLDMAKISAGKLELEAATFNLCDSISEALAPLEAQAREKGLAFNRQALHDTYSQPWVVGDAHRLNQVLLNLVSNAIKFTAAGSITVSSSLMDETVDALSVRFCVADTGPGIEADKQALIFESFTQANADTARHHGGTGLGLSISRALVAQMGGQLRLASTPGQGSSFDFEVRFPKAPVPTVNDDADAAYNTGRLVGARVLLVEDNEINRTVARMMLEPWGVELDEAEDGATALARLAETDYDLVLTDIQMPGLSGIDVTQRLRQMPEPRRAATPIIALTANAFRADVERYLAAGVNACLTKPYDEVTLYQTMEALLPALPPAAPAYNLAPLREMAKGREAFVHKIVRSFLTNMPRSLAQLKAAGAAANWPEVGRLAHHIKPNLHTLGICDVTSALEVLVQLHSEEPAAVPEAPAVLRHALAQLVAGVERALAGLCAELKE
ncbi:PAS domain-containing hybrid sensor histidine kinase/response regulator [Hymenobacter glaciei]|uniref:PAS domain-containing hybrid sensor histidine kinase/response regulator n=1 Tax=Hymenobacter glaciei TaxID=877209 RepID=UPI0031E81B44